MAEELAGPVAAPLCTEVTAGAGGALPAAVPACMPGCPRTAALPAGGRNAGWDAAGAGAASSDTFTPLAAIAPFGGAAA